MQEIDRPFRFTWEFVGIWTLLAIPATWLVASAKIRPWYSAIALAILVALFSTFVIYGPVLLWRQVIHSGTRGRLALRTLLSLICVGTVLFVGLLLSGFYTEGRAQILGFLFSGLATAYLNWKMEKRSGM